MNRCTRSRLFGLLLALLFLCSLGACKQRETTEEFFARGERMNRDCRPIVGDRFIYRTAAGFRLSTPTWLRGSPSANHYTPDCRLNYLRIDFAWVDERLIPVPQGGIALPKDVVVPRAYEPVIVMMKFRSPALDVPPDAAHFCRNRQPLYDYPQFRLRMCPTHINIFGVASGLGFAPRFEIGDKRDDPAAFTCDASDFEGLTAANVYEASIKYACRGHWTWRPGAHAIVDIERGKVLRKADKVMRAVEQTLDAWAVHDPGVRRAP